MSSFRRQAGDLIILAPLRGVESLRAPNSCQTPQAMITAPLVNASTQTFHPGTARPYLEALLCAAPAPAKWLLPASFAVPTPCLLFTTSASGALHPITTSKLGATQPGAGNASATATGAQRALWRVGHPLGVRGSGRLGASTRCSALAAGRTPVRGHHAPEAATPHLLC